jgi:polar amino acid transport system substrate-binding protein
MTCVRGLAAWAAWATALVLVASPARADSLDDIQKRGVLRWGGDSSGGGPFIFEGPDRKLAGFEVDLAEYLAKELGVRAEFVQGPWDRLLDRLDRGDIDIVLNGYEWSPERQKRAAPTIPYYVYKLQLLVRTGDDSIRSWDDLPGKRVGVLRDSAAHRYLETRFGDTVRIEPFEGVTDTMGLVQDEQLDATLQDLPAAIFYRGDFPKLRRMGEPVAPGYYVVFVPTAEDRLMERLNQAILRGIKNGTLQRIYEKYGLWNADQEQLLDLSTRWPPAADGATEDRWADLRHFGKQLLWAAGVTALLACISMPLAMLLGLQVAVGRLYGPRWLAATLTAYVEIMRGTPLLLQLLVIYYILPKLGIRIPAFWAGIIGLALNYSAYEAENYRAGLLAVPRGQLEAALALGMSRWTALRRVIIPQAVRIVIPPVTNDFIALFKDTSVCMVIAVTDLTGMYYSLANRHPGYFLELVVMTATLYMVLSYPLSLVARRLERRFKAVPI